MRFDRRMSDTEALMWTIEKDPALRSSFLQITILDQQPDYERFRGRMARAVELLPRLRQRPSPAPVRLAPPAWEDDASFDLDYHVRHLAVPAPGTDRQLLDLAAVLYEDAFDRARPLWNITIVDGLEGGRAALLTKMHHTITDGVGGVRLSTQFIDLARDAPDPEPVETLANEPTQDRLVGALAHNLRRQAGIAGRAAGNAVSLATHPRRVPALVADSAEMARSIARQLAVVQKARSSLWTDRSLGRRFEILSVSLDDVKRAAKGLGGTVNDLFVAAVAGGAGTYHRAKGAPVDELRMSMPVSTRDDRSAGGNAFSPTRVLVPAGIADPVERFTAIRDRLGVTKRERAVAVFGPLAGLIGGLPTSLLVRVARQQAETVDFAASNLRAADFDLYVAGAKILANHPMGPTAGTAFNATVMSYRDGFDIGINIDRGAVNYPELLRDCILDSFGELIAAGSS